MKKLLACVLAAVLSLESVLCVFGGEVTVVLNDEVVEFPSAEPVIVDGRTLIPLRGVFEKLGYEISWENATKTASFKRDGSAILVTVGSDVFVADGEAYPLDVPACIIDGSMMLPLRAVGEATGLKVDWDEATKTVYLSSYIDIDLEESYNRFEEVLENISTLDGAAEWTVSLCGYYALLEFYLSEVNTNLSELSDVVSSTINSKKGHDLVLEGLEACEGYREVLESVPCLKRAEGLYDEFTALLDVTDEYYELLKAAVIDREYDSDRYSNFDRKSSTLLREINEQLASAEDTLGATEILCQSLVPKKYHYPFIEDEDSEGEEVYNNYLMEIAAEINPKILAIDYAEPKKGEFKALSAALLDKLEKTETPENCMFAKAMLKQCGYELGAIEGIVGQSDLSDKTSQHYREYRIRFLSVDIALAYILDDYFAEDPEAEEAIEEILEA